MEYNKIIIILIVIVLVMAIVVGVMVFQSNSKDSTQINITSGMALYEGGNLSVHLFDSNKTSISGQNINFVITSENGNVVKNETIKTDSKGNAKLTLDLVKGNYTVDVIYEGNDNYTGCNATQNLIIKEKEVVEQIPSSDTSSASQSTYASGLTDDEIEAYIQRDLDVRAQNGVEGDYDYEDARYFYENVPPTGMV